MFEVFFLCRDGRWISRGTYADGRIAVLIAQQVANQRGTISRVMLGGRQIWP